MISVNLYLTRGHYISDFNNVVDLIMLHNCASDEEKTIVYKLAEQNGLKVCEQNFDLMY